MKINPIISANTFKAKEYPYNVTPKTMNSPIYPNTEYNKKPKTGKIILGILGAIAAAYGIYVAVMIAKKPPKISFEELLNKKGLEFRNNVLVNKSTGENFTGELKRSTNDYGKGSGFKNIETRRFEEGIITEKTNKDLWGNEISGKFYKEGQLFSDVEVYYEREGKIFSFSIYKKNGNQFAIGHGKCQKKKDSVFKDCREWIKNDWPENSDWFRGKK